MFFFTNFYNNLYKAFTYFFEVFLFFITLAYSRVLIRWKQMQHKYSHWNCIFTEMTWLPSHLQTTKRTFVKIQRIVMCALVVWYMFSFFKNVLIFFNVKLNQIRCMRFDNDKQFFNDLFPSQIWARIVVVQGLPPIIVITVIIIGRMLFTEKCTWRPDVYYRMCVNCIGYCNRHAVQCYWFEDKKLTLCTNNWRAIEAIV